MKNKLSLLLLLLALLVGLHKAAAQNARFFRISGPAPPITAFRNDGTMVWSNAQPGATFTVQTAASMPGGTNWVDYVQIPATNAMNTNLLMAFNPPAGWRSFPPVRSRWGILSGWRVLTQPQRT